MLHPLHHLLERAETWPKAAVDELMRVAEEIEGELAPDYGATPDELRGIDRGLRDANAAEFASVHEVEAALEKFRRP